MLKVWVVESGKCLRTLSGHSFGVRGCAFSPNGRLALSASDDEMPKVWVVESGK